MGNMNAIIAGEAYIRYYAPTQEFEKDNRQNEQSFKGAQGRMWREYLRHRFNFEKFMARERARERQARRAEEKDIRDGLERRMKWEQGVHERAQARRDAERARERQQRDRDADRRKQEKRRVIEFSRNQDRLYRQFRESQENRWQQFYANTQNRAFAMYQARLQRQAVAQQRATQQAQRQQQRAMQQAQRQQQQAQQKYQQNLQTVTAGGLFLGDRMSGMGRQGIAGIMDSVLEFGSVEQFMNQIRGSIKDNTDDIIGDMQRLEKQAYALGEATEYDAVHIASAMDRMAIANASGTQIVENMRPVIDIASIFSNPTSGKIMPDQASRTMLEIMNDQDQGFDWLPQLADKLAVAGRQADLSLENLGDALRYAGATATEAGVSFDELLASILVLDKRGQKGEMGGTAVRGILASLLDPTDSAREQYTQFGINIPTSGKLSLIDIIQQFEQKLEGLDEIQRAAVISKAFPNRQMTGVQVLMGASGQIRDMMGQTANSQGKAAEIAATKREGVSFALDVFDSAFQTLKAAFGKTLAADVSSIAKALASGMGQLAQIFERYPTLGRSLGVLAVGLSAFGLAIGTLMTAVGGMVGMRTFLVAARGLQAAGAASSVAATVTSAGGSSAATAGIGSLASQAVGGLVSSVATAFAAALSSPAVLTALAAGLAVALDHFFNDGKIRTSLAAVLQNQNTPDSGAGNSAPPGTPEALAAEYNKQFPNPYDSRRRHPDSFRTPTEFGTPMDKKYPFGKPSTPDFSFGQSLFEMGTAYTDQQQQKALAKRRQGAAAEKLAKDEAIKFDSSKDNPKNKAAWEAFAAEHADPMDAAILNDPAAFTGYLRSYRKAERKASMKPAEAPKAMAVLGDYNLRGESGINMMLDMLGNKRFADSAQTEKEMLAAQERTAEATEKIAGGLGRGLKLGKGKS